MPKVVKTISAHLTTLKGSVDDCCMLKEVTDISWWGMHESKAKSAVAGTEHPASCDLHARLPSRSPSGTLAVPLAEGYLRATISIDVIANHYREVSLETRQNTFVIRSQGGLLPGCVYRTKR
jgi:hypothetical protein